MNNKKLMGGLALVLGLSAAMPAVSEDWKIYFNPMVGYQYYAGDKGLKQDIATIVGIEYRFTNRWAVEFRYTETEANRNSSGDDEFFGEADDREVEQFQYFLDGIHYFREMGNKYQPYVAVGIGQAEYEWRANGRTRDRDPEDLLNFGFGTRIEYTPLFSLRLDARAVRSLDEHYWDSMIGLGLSLGF